MTLYLEYLGFCGGWGFINGFFFGNRRAWQWIGWAALTVVYVIGES